MEQLEVVKIHSTTMREDKRKKKYLRVVQEIRERSGSRSGRLGSIKSK